MDFALFLAPLIVPGNSHASNSKTITINVKIYTSVESFKKYYREEEDVKRTLAKLPKHYQELVKGYKFLFEPHNTLRGDDKHVGIIDAEKKRVVISSSWAYPREHVMLHEVGHLVYQKYVKGTPLEKQWSDLVKKTPLPKKDKDTDEELACHAFAAYYTKNRVAKFDIPSWMDFIKNLP